MIKKHLFSVQCKIYSLQYKSKNRFMHEQNNIFQQKKISLPKKRLWSLIIIIPILIIIIFCGLLIYQTKIYSLFIKNFDECAKAGFDVIPSDPPRCFLSEEVVFIRDPQHIRITEPTENLFITSPLTIKGEARSLNNQIGYTLKNETGAILAEGITKTQNTENNQWENYTQSIEFDKQDSQTGILQIYDLTNNKIKINITEIPVLFVENAEINENNINKIADPLNQADKSNLPQKVTLEVPFTSQAPFANWDPPFDEACEEASLIMVDYYLAGKNLDQTIATDIITAMATWEANNGYKIDITLQELQKVAQDYLNRTAFVYYDDDVSEENIKYLISVGYPVIIPSAGHSLGNPYFSGEGPPYHMLVITGYDENYFYTNDPGTKRGEDYKYKPAVIMNSIHDWNGNVETIQEGKKTMMIVVE